MRWILFCLSLLLSSCFGQKASTSAQKVANQSSRLTPFEKNENSTATYEEAINFYQALAQSYPQLQLTPHGTTDVGLPLHTAVLSADQDFDPISIRKKNKNILFINNAIHAGEPCGVDASMMLLRNYLEDKSLQKFLEKTVIVVIPMYNLGGVLNRNSHTRTNQNGPESYGFRGNAKNLDLNRDFIKCDSKNAETLNKIYNYWQPDIFIDNHTSNGADYQYTITLIATQHNKLDPHLAAYLNATMLPRLFLDMKKTGWEMTPYVYARSTPDAGIAGFLDLPRYSSGYAALHNAISFMPETHMLKPFKDRVRSTYAFMDVMIKLAYDDAQKIQSARSKAIENTKTKNDFDLNWTLDTERSDQITFKGYEAKKKPSAISGEPRLYYDHDEPYEKKIAHFNYYKATATVQKPRAYIIPQGYAKVIERLRWNNVKVEKLEKDFTVEVERYRIKDFDSRKQPYEGHYLHSQVEVEKFIQQKTYKKGDYIVYVNQASNRYIVETLEPTAPDSYFAWNFFDGILQQKEYFSAYVFEDLAEQILKENPDLKKRLDERKKEDADFAKSGYAQLEFIYKNSPHYETTHRIYPVARLLN
ncbi:MAG: M14 family zinc carboxypeptidase [Bacteroidota bacterium]